ncbi:hypothetical protein ACJX0J_005944, partial [Zea mays]
MEHLILFAKYINCASILEVVKHYSFSVMEFRYLWTLDIFILKKEHLTTFVNIDYVVGWSGASVTLGTCISKYTCGFRKRMSRRIHPTWQYLVARSLVHEVQTLYTFKMFFLLKFISIVYNIGTMDSHPHTIVGSALTLDWQVLMQHMLRVWTFIHQQVTNLH